MLDRAAAGEEIVVLRRDVEVARIVGPERGRTGVPSLSEFRKRIHVAGKPLSEVVIDARRDERA